MLLRFFSGVLAFSLIVPARTQTPATLPPELEKSYRLDATQKVDKAAEIYNNAVAAFQKGGAEAFLAAMPKGAFNPTEREYLRRELGRYSSLPKLVAQKDKIFFYDKKMKQDEMDTFDIAQGIFIFSGVQYQYDSGADLPTNLERWKSQDKHSALERVLNGLLLPQAEAFTQMVGLIVGAILGALIGVFLFPMIAGWINGGNKDKDKKADGAPDGFYGPNGPGGPHVDASPVNQAAPAVRKGKATDDEDTPEDKKAKLAEELAKAKKDNPDDHEAALKMMELSDQDIAAYKIRGVDGEAKEKVEKKIDEFFKQAENGKYNREELRTVLNGVFLGKTNLKKYLLSDAQKQKLDELIADPRWHLKKSNIETIESIQD